MKCVRYREIVEGVFIDRPNRFIAHMDVNGTVETVHVKNTGRCRELLVLGSGLGNLTADFTETEELPYKGIPNFPASRL